MPLSRDHGDTLMPTSVSAVADVESELTRKKGQAAESGPPASQPGDASIQAILENGTPLAISRLFKHVQSAADGGRLVDWAITSPSFYYYERPVWRLLLRLPQVFNIERGRRLAQACISLGEASVRRRSLAGYLLEKGVFSSADLLALYHKIGPSGMRKTLLTHPLATVEMWLEQAREKSLSRGDDFWGYPKQQYNLLCLHSHPAAMAVSEVRRELFGRQDLWESFGDEFRYAQYFLRKVPPDGVKDVAQILFEMNPIEALQVFGRLSASQRREIPKEWIVEMAATHPDSRVRQAAILFGTNLGEQVRLRKPKGEGKAKGERKAKKNETKETNTLQTPISRS